MSDSQQLPDQQRAIHALRTTVQMLENPVASLLAEVMHLEKVVAALDLPLPLVDFSPFANVPVVTPATPTEASHTPTQTLYTLTQASHTPTQRAVVLTPPRLIPAAPPPTQSPLTTPRLSGSTPAGTGEVSSRVTTEAAPIFALRPPTRQARRTAAQVRHATSEEPGSTVADHPHMSPGHTPEPAQPTMSRGDQPVATPAEQSSRAASPNPLALVSALAEELLMPATIVATPATTPLPLAGSMSAATLPPATSPVVSTQQPDLTLLATLVEEVIQAGRPQAERATERAAPLDNAPVGSAPRRDDPVSSVGAMVKPTAALSTPASGKTSLPSLERAVLQDGASPLVTPVGQPTPRLPDAHTLAQWVNEVLVEDALRHGVDLS